LIETFQKAWAFDSEQQDKEAFVAKYIMSWQGNSLEQPDGGRLH
jgi:hypothetical protein